MARTQLTRPASARPAAVLADRDRPARALRVSAHESGAPGSPGGGVVVLSLWDGATCTATLRLDPHDVPDLVRALSTAAVRAAEPPVTAAS